MSDTNLRVRGVSEIVDAAFALYRRNALQYILVTAIAQAPTLILSLLMSGDPPTTPAEVVKYLPVIAVSLLGSALVSAAIVRMGSDVYLGGSADVGATIRRVLPRVPVLLVTTIIIALLAVIAMIFLILPVLLVIAFFSATVPALVLEKKGVFSAMGRSAKLSKGVKGHILGTVLLVVGIFFVLSMGISLGATALGSTMLASIISTVFGVVAAPIIHLVIMVLYYDLRIRSEGFDVEHMAQSLGSEPSPMGSAPG